MLIASTAALALLAATASPAPQDTERFRAWLDTPGGDLPFFIELTGTEAFLVNGSERIPVPAPDRTGGAFRLEMPYFDSVLEATPSEDDPQRLDGTWRKVRGADNTAEVPFHMDARLPWRFEPKNGLSRMADAVAGRWQVDFESGDVPAVGLFEAGEGLDVTGTFLTNTGDYRYLAGEFRQEELLLSCFDGAHAFLFRAELNEAGTLSGKFWSGDWWEESWTAERNAEAALPNAFEEVEALYEAPVASLSFPDSKGVLRHVMDYTPNSEVLLVQIFGSWCPNCHDETAYLRELDERYRDRGLRIVGLAFELTGDVKRDGAQLDKFRERHGIEYPLLLAGKANKAATALALGLTDKVLSYPTTLFVDRLGAIRGIHSGFAGPATGLAHEELRVEFESRIEQLLGEPTLEQRVKEGTLDAMPSTRSHWALFLDRPWLAYNPVAPGPARFDFELGDGGWTMTLTTPSRGEAGSRELPMIVRGAGIQIGSQRYYMQGPFAFGMGNLGANLVANDDGDLGAASWPSVPFTARGGADAWQAQADFLRSPDAPVMSQRTTIAAWAWSEQIKEEQRRLLLELLGHRSVHVQAQAAWALGQHPHPASREGLTAALDSPNPVVRREAAAALGALPKDPDTKARLADLSKNDPHRLVRDAAVSAWNALRVQNH